MARTSGDASPYSTIRTVGIHSLLGWIAALLCSIAARRGRCSSTFRCQLPAGSHQLGERPYGGSTALDASGDGRQNRRAQRQLTAICDARRSPALAQSLVLSAIDERGVATLTLNRPEVHNAYDGAMIDGLIEAVGALAAEERVRLLVLRANGKHFQAGADLAWLREVAGFALEDNVAFSRRTTLAMRALNAFPRP